MTGSGSTSQGASTVTPEVVARDESLGSSLRSDAAVVVVAAFSGAVLLALLDVRQLHFDAWAAASAATVVVGLCLALLDLSAVGATRALRGLAGLSRWASASARGLVTALPLAWGLWRGRGAEELPGAWWAVLVAVGGSLSVVWGALGRRGVGRGGSGNELYAALLLIVPFLDVHHTLGTLAVVRATTGWLHLGLYVASWVGSAVLLVPLSRRTAGVEKPSSWAVMLLFGAGIASAAASRRILVGLYEPVHAWLDWVALLLLASAVTQVLRTSRGRRAPVGAVAGVALAGLLGAALVILVRIDEPRFRSALGQSTAGMMLLEVSAGGASATPPGSAETAPAALGLAPVSMEGALDNDFNVLLVTVDGMRADYVTSDRAPRIFELSRRSAFFERAYSQGSKTAIGMSTLMTGRYSAFLSWYLWAAIGKELYRAGAPELREHAGSHLYTSLPDFPPGSLLSERLRGRGFLTMAAPDGGPTGFFRPGTGLTRGFHQLVDIGALDVPVPSSKVVAGIAVAQRRAAPPGRWFQWVHLYDPHRLLDRPDYDRLVRAADQGVALLLDALAADGLAERTIVVLAADHGRALDEHGGSGHAWALYEEQIRVPLAIRVPGMAPVIIREPVACIDATATVLVLAGASLEGVQGRNLLPAMRSGRLMPLRPIYSELHAHLSTSGARSTDLKAVIDGSLKLVVDRKRELLELYDLASDPREMTNLIGARPDETRRLYRLEQGFSARAAERYSLP